MMFMYYISSISIASILYLYIIGLVKIILLCAAPLFAICVRDRYYNILNIKLHKLILNLFLGGKLSTMPHKD